VYYIDKLPAKIVFWPDIVLIALAAGTITFLATLYPAHRAAKLDPLEAIRFG
jgi:lipoprotein-releasing system permease protein